MTKKRNYENEEEYKNFNLEDYLPSMNSRKPEDIPSASGQETAIFPPLDEPDTSDIQVAVSKLSNRTNKRYWRPQMQTRR